jgi:DNA-binding transcriptional regulator YiaG
MRAMKMKSRSRQHRTAAEKAELVAAYHLSGLSQAAFAQQHGIAPSNIQRWARQHENLAPSQGAAALLEVPNLLASRPGAGAYRLHFPHGLQLELTRGFNVEEVRALAQLLQDL